MDYTGKVTAVEDVLWVFQLDHHLTVYLGYLKSIAERVRMPGLDETVTLRKAYCHHELRYEVIVTERRQIWYHDPGAADGECATLPELVRELQLGFDDLRRIAEIAVSAALLSRNLADSPAKFAVAAARILKRHNPAPVVHYKTGAANDILGDFSLSVVSQKRYIDVKKCGSVPEAPYWTCGVFSKVRLRDYLVGFLYVKGSFGMLRLKDDKHTMFCLVTGDTDGSLLKKIVNNLVIIKRYHIFNELYREGVHNIEYIVFNAKDVAVVKNITIVPEISASTANFLPENTAQLPGYSLKWSFILESRSTISYSDRAKQRQCWLKATIKDDIKGEKILLCLKEPQFSVLPFLKPNYCYTVHHKLQIEACSRQNANNFLAKLERDVQQIEFHKSDVVTFTMDHVVEGVSHTLSVSQALKKIKDDKDSTKIVSITGFVKSRNFMGADAPYKNVFRVNGKKPECFGMPGSKKQKVTLEDRLTGETIDIFMHNWELLQMPFGLIPGMQIAIYDVIFAISQNIYVKPTPLTRIEVLGYAPKKPFHTCSLLNDDDWGLKSFLGYGNHIPTGVLVWGTPCKFTIKLVKIEYKRDAPEKLEIKLSLTAKDEKGEFFVRSRSLKLLALLLEQEVERFRLHCLRFVPTHRYNYKDVRIGFEQSVQNAFHVIDMKVNNVASKAYKDIGLKCRKLASSQEYASRKRPRRGENYFDSENHWGSELPMWFCVDAERV